ncbi:MAG: ATP-binding protein, partial [Acidimicrobiales bacterium]
SWVVDPKGEYGALAAACGTVPLRVAPGGTVRLNPLDTAPADRSAGEGGESVGRVRRQVELSSSLAEASLRRRLAPSERTAIELAVRRAGAVCDHPTLPDLVAALLDPDPELAATVRTDAGGLAADGRQVALELRRLVQGDLAGMFDGPTSAGIDLDGPLVVLDLSALYTSPALGILMTCATAWLQATLLRGDGVKRLVVVDEAWAILHDLAMARWLQACFKLSRQFGVANIAVVHRLSDLRSAGGAGSEQQRLAEGLLSDSESRVVFGQPPSEVDGARQLLGLTTTEAELLPQLPRVVALWLVGERSFLVELQLGAAEARLVDTDAAMLSGKVLTGQALSGQA